MEIAAAFSGGNASWTLKNSSNSNVASGSVTLATAPSNNPVEITINEVLTPGTYTFTSSIDLKYNSAAGNISSYLTMNPRTWTNGGGGGTGYLAANLQVEVPISCARMPVTIEEKDPATCCPDLPTLLVSDGTSDYCTGGAGNITSSLGANGSASTTASDYNFQWEVNTGSGWNNAAGSSATTVSLGGSDVVTNGSGDYRLTITLKTTSCSITSNEVTITIPTVPTFTTSAPVAQCVGTIDLSGTVQGLTPSDATLSLFYNGEWKYISC